MNLIKKSVGQLNQEANQSPRQSAEEVMAIFDKLADEDFAKEYGIEIEDIPAFVAMMKAEL